jgi:hypothetical protein
MEECLQAVVVIPSQNMKIKVLGIRLTLKTPCKNYKKKGEDHLHLKERFQLQSICL